MDRTVKVRLEAAVSGFQASMARASATTKQFGSEVGHASRTARQEMQTVGTALAVVGGAAALGFGMAGKAAIDFESSFAGVRKTVNATEPEFEKLAAGMRNMAREIPTGVNELNSIGEAAGQLGIETKNLLGFTRTMADLGETTNLSADEAATALARLANITQMPQTEFDKLGSVIVALGNNFATTEAEIVDMGQRIAGAGAQIGMTEPEIMAVAAALSSLGIESQAGGTAISKVMIDIASEVENGGDKLATFAEVAGMSADEFSAAFRDDATAAIGEFVTGLGSMEESGGSTLQVLEELGITEVRMRDALLRASGAGDLWARTGEVANTAWEENVALTQEAAQRYETVGAKIDIARNAINDAAITVGQTFSPAIGFAAESVAGLAGGIADLPGPAATAVTTVGALGGAASLAAGGFLLAAPRIVETKDALKTLSVTMPTATRALKGASSMLMGPVGIALGAAVVGIGLFAKAKADATAKVEDFKATLDEETGAITENTRAHALNRLEQEGLIDAARTLDVSLQDLTDAALGDEAAWLRVQAASDAAVDSLKGAGDEMTMDVKRMADVERASKNLESGLAGVNSSLEQSQEEFRKSAEDAAEAEGKYYDVAHAIRDGLDPATASMIVRAQEQAAAQDEAGVSADGLGGEMDDLTGDVDETTSALETYIDTTKKATDPVYALNSALQSVEDAQKSYTEAVDEHGVSSEEARQAAMELTSAVASAEAAAIDGDLSFDAFEKKLRDWVAMGVLTADQADATRDRVAGLRGEAENYEGAYEATILADTDDAETNLAAFERRLSFISGRTWTVNLSARYGRIASPTAGSGGIPEQHSGGWAGVGPEHVGSLAADEHPAILQKGEFVVRAAVAQQNGPLLQALNAGRFHDGGQVGAPVQFTPGGGSTTTTTVKQYFYGPMDPDEAGRRAQQALRLA